MKIAALSAALLLAAAPGLASAQPTAAPAEPRIWSPADLQRPDAPAPDILDAATHGDHYRAWTMGKDGLSSRTLLVQMKAGQRAGAHVHSLSSHYSCVLQGVALVWIEGRITRVGAGACFTIPLHLLHDVGADTTGDAWFVETTAPLNPVPGIEPTRQDEVRARAAEIEATFKAAQTKP